MIMNEYMFEELTTSLLFFYGLMYGYSGVGRGHNLEKAMAPHSSTLAGKSHGRRSLVGCSPWGHKELDTTE